MTADDMVLARRTRTRPMAPRRVDQMDRHRPMNRPILFLFLASSPSVPIYLSHTTAPPRPPRFDFVPHHRSASVRLLRSSLLRVACLFHPHSSHNGRCWTCVCWFPVVSRSGKIWRLVAEAKDAKLAHLKLHGTPGGAPAFGLAAKFCYNVHVDVTVANLAKLRCAVRYLQMTDDFSDKNLELCAGAFDVNLVARLIAAIANNVCKEQLASRLLSRLDQSRQLKPQTVGLVELVSPGGGLLGQVGRRPWPADDGHELGIGFPTVARRAWVAARSLTSDAYGWGWRRDDSERRAACSPSGGSRCTDTRSRAAYAVLKEWHHRTVRICPPGVAAVLDCLELLSSVA
ncbi:hypothetical protein QYE76_070704 [Lolium multiflorum]|uniref:Uncharacterized protein n=1 Tax=Lolium multiflorum TaxID=4521 RepID=A0AAD8SJS2_LOLMU|nr:hypothetical protein QYE76_070704 [Lolium multiflorum]